MSCGNETLYKATVKKRKKKKKEKKKTQVHMIYRYEIRPYWFAPYEHFDRSTRWKNRYIVSEREPVEDLEHGQSVTS